ncbi:amino acid permease-domain-containing protein [Amylocarpus encephaloides]|uniref:Amino acid permease-domain-containing protein n=1 Tax=Amylocarpus encephaloides TaxID=45428 RepID=A0A9P7YCX4_9HELO|nr:amino acid permease-domain-containing protein [Amylocarpus encephaloides]
MSLLTEGEGKRHSTSSHPQYDPRRPSVTTVLPAGDVPNFEGLTADEAALVALGYKQEFKREFSLWTTFCVSFAVLGLLPSFASTLYYGMGYAGTGGMVWGWIISWIFIQCVAMGMAELCSSMPTSGGLYYAAAVLAPPGWGPFAAWITGWSNWMVQVTGAPSVDYALSAMILAAASITHPGYVPTDWQTFLLTVFVMLIHGCISSMPTLWIARFNSYGSTLNMVALLVVIIMIPTSVTGTDTTPKFFPSKQVWTIQNGTDWPDGVAVLMSFIAIIWTMSGYDAPFHLSEECSNANIAAPRAIVMTSGVGGLAGWALQLVVAYTVVDITEALESDLGQPWASYLVQVMPRNTALAILGLTICCGFFMGQGCMVAASRVTFAYARDDCFPFSSWIKQVNKHTYTPVNAVWFNTIVGICLLLLIFGGEVAIGAIFSVGAIAAYVAFTIPIFIRVFFVGERFRRGPWHLGKFSKPIGAIACSFILVMVPILCLPSVRGNSLTAELMNWTIVVYGGPMMFVLIWWFASAHKWFHGPVINVEHHMIGRDEVVEGVENSSTSDAHSIPGKKGDIDATQKSAADLQ